MTRTPDWNLHVLPSPIESKKAARGKVGVACRKLIRDELESAQT